MAFYTKLALSLFLMHLKISVYREDGSCDSLQLEVARRRASRSGPIVHQSTNLPNSATLVIIYPISFSDRSAFTSILATFSNTQKLQ